MAGGRENLRSTDQWIEEISKVKLPVGLTTAQDASLVIADRGSSASDLSDVIKKDAMMSARLLRIANSSLHRARAGNTETIEQAVVNLGYENISTLTNTVAVVETLLKDSRGEFVKREMAHAFHAAAQAQALAEFKAEGKSGEVYSAALLYRIGRIAFWSLPESLTAEMQLGLLDDPEAAPQSIEQKVLGFDLHKLTTALCDTWNLGGVLKKALIDPKSKTNSMTASIVTGHEIADSVEKVNGAKSFSLIVSQVSKILGVSDKEAKAFINKNTEDAIRNTKAYGASGVAKYIPKPGDTATGIAESDTKPTVSEATISEATQDSPLHTISASSEIDGDAVDMLILGAEQEEEERQEQERLESEREEEERLEKERLEQEHQERERLEKEHREELERLQEERRQEQERLERERLEQERAREEAEREAEQIRSQAHDYNYNAQVDSLRSLSELIDTKPAASDFLAKVLESIHQGVGLDRSVLAMLNKRNHTVKAVYAMGEDYKSLTEQFVFDVNLDNGDETLFKRQVAIGKPLFIPAEIPDELAGLLPESILDITGRQGFFSAPIMIFNACIGLYYGDRSISGREMDDLSYNDFKHFVEKANEGLLKLRRA